MKRQQWQLVAGILALLVLVGFLYLVSTPDVSMMGRVKRDLARDKARFLPENSLDIAMAMKMVTHDPPKMLNPPTPPAPLLLYPPSEETLARLSGV